MSIEIIDSGDGSHTLYNSELNETYHSHKGAITESRHVFLYAGVDFVKEHRPEISILEIGFGTGLNALLTLDKADAELLTTYYVTLEPFPLPGKVVDQLNYASIMGGTNIQRFNLLHNAEWNKKVNISPFFTLEKCLSTLEKFESQSSFDVIFFDAFAPNKQPEVWSIDNLVKCFRLLKEGGVLVTYCAQGQFKRNLKEAGFEVQTIEGPPGKKEMTRGIKKTEM